MDKFFILNAFKTLDEIEAENKNKKSLKENFNKPLKEDYDLDELQDKYIGQGCTVGTKDDYSDEHATIKGLKDFKGNFENSIWEVALDIGVIINVEGKDLKLDLEEKLPKDLARAYNNTDTKNSSKFVGDVRFPKEIRRNAESKIDYENSNYTEISKEEAKKNYSKKGPRAQLRVIISGQVMRWDEDNNLISKPDGLPSRVNPWSFKSVIDNADKIYVTDELNNIIVNKETLSDEDQQRYDEFKKLDNDGGLPSYWTSDPKLRKVRKVADKIGTYYMPGYQVGTTKSGRTALDVPDTGNHEFSGRGSKYNDFDYKQYKYYKERYNEALKELEGIKKVNKTIDESTINHFQSMLNVYLERMNAYKSRSDKNIRQTNNNNHEAWLKANEVNFNLCFAIIYKYLANKLKQEFLETDKGSSEDWRINNHEYKRLSDQLVRLEAQLRSITIQINDVKSKLTPELKQQYEDLLLDQTSYLGEQWEETVSKLNKLLHKDTEETNESLTESLNEEYIRIYTVDQDDYEDFIDNDYENLDSVIDYAKSIFHDGDYKRVCVVKIDVEDGDEEVNLIWDSDDEDLEEEIKDKRSIGEIVDDKLKNESLTESKKFNIRDDDQIANAKIYKTIGEKTNADLVVVDPSIESLDQEQEPKVGDSILQCKSCKTTIFKKPDNLKQDEEDNSIYNLEDPCPHCGDSKGYILIGQVAKKDSEDAQKLENENQEDIDTEENVEDIELPEEENNSEESGLEPVENDFVDLDEVDDIQEESFNKLINPYLTKLYENVKDFKTTDVKQIGRNKIIIEGLITGKNNKQINTQFLFTIKENKAGSIVFEGYNKLLTEQKDSFQLKSKYENKSLLFESLSYKYNKGDQLIEGLEQNK